MGEVGMVAEYHTMEATPESDRRLSQYYYEMGMQDRMTAREPRFGPAYRLVYQWYMRGYNAIMAE